MLIYKQLSCTTPTERGRGTFPLTPESPRITHDEIKTLCNQKTELTPHDIELIKEYLNDEPSDLEIKKLVVINILKNSLTKFNVLNSISLNNKLKGILSYAINQNKEDSADHYLARALFWFYTKEQDKPQRQNTLLDICPKMKCLLTDSEEKFKQNIDLVCSFKYIEIKDIDIDKLYKNRIKLKIFILEMLTQSWLDKFSIRGDTESSFLTNRLSTFMVGVGVGSLLGGVMVSRSYR